jgi:hypothetical protein
MLPFDLHVLGMPPAFNLSQDQTLHLSFRQLCPCGLKPSIFLKRSFPTKTKLITDFLLGGTLALLGQVVTFHRKTSTQFTCAHCQRSFRLPPLPVTPRDLSSRVSRPFYIAFWTRQHLRAWLFEGVSARVAMPAGRRAAHDTCCEYFGKAVLGTLS